MKSSFILPARTTAYCLIFSLLGASGPAFAQNSQEDDASPPAETSQQQNPPASPGGWRRVGDPPANQPSYSPSTNDRASDNAQNRYPNPPAGAPNNSGDYPIPLQLTLKPGTFVTARVNQMLSSDHNRAGDTFSATLVKPLVVDGVVVAQRGQTLGGRVTETQKAGRVEGVSRLGIQLTDLTLVDGQQTPIQTQFITWVGQNSKGRDVGAVAGTTAAGAAIGAAADWGRGAGIGAAAGAAAGMIGVLLTRGRPTVIYPESVLTFRIQTPVTISTERAPLAFRYVDPNDYERPYEAQAQVQQAPVNNCGAYGCAPPPPPPYYYGYGYGWPGYYPYYRPGFSVFVGPGFYGPGFFGPRSYYRGGYYRGGFRGRRW